jgi:hypothetical protein
VGPSSRIVSKIQMSHETAIKVTEECTYHGEESNIHVCKSVAEESRKSYVVDRTLSAGLFFFFFKKSIYIPEYMSKTKPGRN